MRPRVESLLQFTIRSANFRSFWDLLSPGKSQNLKIETLAFFVSKIVTLQIEAFLPLSVCSMILGCLEYQVVGVRTRRCRRVRNILRCAAYVCRYPYSDFLEGFSAFNRMLLIDSF